MEKIVILIPNYNNDKYINQTFESIFQQSNINLFKVLICDDCSKDNSINIINEWIIKYPTKIKLLLNDKNYGLLYTSIKLYKNIDTEYFTVLDSDDYWINNEFIQDGINYLDKNLDFNIYGTNTKILYQNTLKEEKYTNSNDIIISKLNNENNNVLFSHTSSTIFRNNFNEKILNSIEIYINTYNEQIYEGDSFRNIVHLMNDKLSYIDLSKITGIYRYNIETSRWSSKSKNYQYLLNIIFYLEMYIFYSYKYKNFYNKELNSLIKLYKNTYIDLTINENIIINNKFKEYLDKYNKLFIDNYVFYLPSKYVGGFEIFFIRIAKLLLEMNYQVYYIDYIDGLSRKELNNTNIIFIDYNDNNFLKEFNIPINLIIPFTMMHEKKYITTLYNYKVLYIIAHPKSYYFLQYRSNLKNEKLDNIINNIRDEIVFMDKACSINFKKYYPENNFKYLPIFSPNINIEINNNLINDEINIGWLGRLDSDKIYSVINILNNLYSYKTNKKKNIHIIGSGDSKNLINLEHYLNGNINVIFLNTLLNDEKNNYIIKNFDISFSMGTSGLESASMKIPTIIPMCLEKEKYLTDGFVKFFNLTDYNLGFYDNDIIELNLNTSEFKDILDDIYENNLKSVYGNKCYDYYINNHSQEKTIEYLLNYF